ncbi:diacylglycerol kinase [Streptomyces xiamenensis]|uniref:diacylglycerol kinase n=1 Tax=Streptomyces xiamenensis TaxID=408015 RepID=UPI0035DA131F
MGAGGEQVLIVIDPAARRADGESVRIARDVLCAGVGAGEAKVRMLEGPQAMSRALARRGSHRVVIVGDDRALVRAVRALHRAGELAVAPLAMVPVGAGPAVALARGLGVPTDAVAASRAVLAGADRPLDLLTDDAGDVVLGALGIPAPRPPVVPWWRRGFGAAQVRGERLRVEADGQLITDVNQPVSAISIFPRSGMAEVVIHHRPEEETAVRASSVTVRGQGFRYRANSQDSEPAYARTWTVLPHSLQLRLPA